MTASGSPPHALPTVCVTIRCTIIIKLEVVGSGERLLDVAEASRRHSQADLMVAYTLEDTAAWAFLGPLEGGYQKVPRRELADRLLAAVEDLYIRRAAGEDGADG